MWSGRLNLRSGCAPAAQPRGDFARLPQLTARSRSSQSRPPRLLSEHTSPPAPNRGCAVSETFELFTSGSTRVQFGSRRIGQRHSQAKVRTSMAAGRRVELDRRRPIDCPRYIEQRTVKSFGELLRLILDLEMRPGSSCPGGRRNRQRSMARNGAHRAKPAYPSVARTDRFARISADHGHKALTPFSSHSGTGRTRGTDGSNPLPSSRQSVSRGISPSCIENPAVAATCAEPPMRHGQQRRAGLVNITPTAGNVSVGSYFSTAVPALSSMRLTQCRAAKWQT